MTLSRLFLESPCEHGKMNDHNAIRLPSGEVVDDTPCPGGSRTEVTGKKLRYCVTHGAVSHFNTVPQCSNSDLDGFPCSWGEAIVVDSGGSDE